MVFDEALTDESDRSARTSSLIRRVYLMGTGHVGGSIARALRHREAPLTVHGFDLDPEHRRIAATYMDHMDQIPAETIGVCDLVVFGVPLAQLTDAVATVAPFLADRAVLTDIGSVKQGIHHAMISALGQHARRVVCVPGHPIAGTEHTGPAAARSDLFVQRPVILTPDVIASSASSAADDASQHAAVSQVVALWEWTGAQVVIMGAREHDAILAATSHLPHLLAFGFVASIRDQLVEESAQSDDAGVGVDQALGRFSAGGFRDFTRIAASDPQMWADIVIANKHMLVPMIDRLCSDLRGLSMALGHCDREQLVQRFAQAQRLRKLVLQQGQAGHFIYNAHPDSDQGA